jgi:hypothetical protein
MTRNRISALTLIVCAAAATPAAAQTTLRYKFKEGDSLNYAMDQKMKMTTSVMGKNIDMNMDQNATMTWKIDSVDSEGNAKITITFGRMKMSMDTPMGKIEVDSQDTDGPDDPIGKALFGVVKAMAGMTVNGKINPLGEVSDVQVPEKVAKQLANLPGAEQMGDMFSPEGLKRMMGQSGLVLPKQAVGKGEKWNHKLDMKLPFGKINAEFNYVYDGPTEKSGRTLEKIGLKPRMSIDPDPNAPFAMKMKSQEGGGHALFDNKAGRLTEVVVNQTMEMELDIMGQTVGQRIVQNVTTRLVDKK